MDEKIIIYGLSKDIFQCPEELKSYLSTDLLCENLGRFRFTQNKNADIIILSREGLAYGHMVVIDKVTPSEEDLKEFHQAKCTYIIGSTVVYGKPVRLYSDLGIQVGAFGKAINQEQFDEIINKAGRIIKGKQRGKALKVESI